MGCPRRVPCFFLGVDTHVILGGTHIILGVLNHSWGGTHIILGGAADIAALALNALPAVRLDSRHHHGGELQAGGVPWEAGRTQVKAGEGRKAAHATTGLGKNSTAGKKTTFSPAPTRIPGFSGQAKTLGIFLAMPAVERMLFPPPLPDRPQSEHETNSSGCPVFLLILESPRQKSQ